MRNLKHVKRIFSIFLTGFLFYSCSQYEEVDSEIEVQQNENFVNQDEISTIASIIEHPISANSKNAIAKAKGITSTFKEVENITKVPDEEGNTTYYIVNYKDEGFVIISADDRVSPILAYSDSEKFPLDRSTYPNGLVEWLVNSKDFIKHVRQNTREQTPQVARAWRLCDIQQRLTGRPPDPCDDGNGGGCQNQYTTIGPLLSTVWGQWGVYNDLAPDLDCGGDGRAPTGCVATAMAQIMKFHEFPNRYNWDNMPDLSGTMETARLMRDAGDAVNMGCNGSGADTRGEVASSFVHDFGYSSASYADFNRETVKQQLRWNRPVILRGGRKSGWWIFGTYADGHAWVCDGYRSSFFCETGTGYLYLHMNWGWSSTQLNGWFAFNNWNPSNHTFNYKRGMVYNIRP